LLPAIQRKQFVFWKIPDFLPCLQKPQIFDHVVVDISGNGAESGFYLMGVLFVYGENRMSIHIFKVECENEEVRFQRFIVGIQKVSL